MALKGLRQFLGFDINAFLKGKQMICASCDPWVDFDTKDVLGTKVDALIVTDDTQYRQKDGQPPVTNRYNRLTFKCSKKGLQVPLDAHIRPVDPIASIYGNFQNELSIKCSDIEIAQTQQSRSATSAGRSNANA